MPGDKPKEVLIIGGGPAGLLAAQALQMQGADVTVFEQDASLDDRPRDWDFGIYWAQVPLAECLPEDLQKDVEKCQVDDHIAGPDEKMPVFNALTEEKLVDLPIPYNLRLRRKKLLQLLSRGISVKYGKRIQTVVSDGESISATFKDGTSETGELLIGAEGAHSVVRDHLLGSETAALVPSHVVATASIVQLPSESVKKFREYCPDNRMFILFHPEGSFTWLGVMHDAPNGSFPEQSKWMLVHSWDPKDPKYDPLSMQGEAALRDLKQRASTFGGGFSSILKSTPDGTRMWHNRLSSWRPEKWDNHNGTITLVGDSAHSMTFHRGQGLNNAIHDVALLAQKTREHGFTAAAIDAYEDEMIPRGRTAVEESNMNTASVHDWEQLTKSPLFSKGLKRE